MIIYAIYDHPKDYPDNFVVRAWRPRADGGLDVSLVAHLATSLEDARAWVPRGFARMDRHDNDDPVIVEVWL